jgi:hypothetical protein
MMSRPMRRRLERELRELDRQGEARRQATVRGYRPGQRLFRAEWLAIGEAVVHPIFGTGTREAIAAAFGSAHGIGPGLLSECWGCGACWRPDWGPALVLTVTLDDGAGGVGLLCEACAGLDGQEAERLVVRGLERDFGLENTRKVPVSALSMEAGRA